MTVTVAVSSPLKREWGVTSGWQVSLTSTANLVTCGGSLNTVEKDSEAGYGLRGGPVRAGAGGAGRWGGDSHILVSSETLGLRGVSGKTNLHAGVLID